MQQQYVFVYSCITHAASLDENYVGMFQQFYVLYHLKCSCEFKNVEEGIVVKDCFSFIPN